jgi:ATP-dependent helicase IRC3
MEIKQIQAIVAETLRNAKNSEEKRTTRKYDTFLSLGSTSETLKKFDDQFKKSNLTLWCNDEARFQMSSFKKGEKVTFRLNETEKDMEEEKSTNTAENAFAGKVTIGQTKSTIKLLNHQEEAIDSLKKAVKEPKKKDFSGLLVLPTGGGKTLTAAYWIAQDYLDKNKKVLWIAHRHELLEQAKNTFAEKLAFSDIFKTEKSFNYRIISGNHDKPVHIKATDDLIISSKDSLNSDSGLEYLTNWLKDEKELLLVIDEAHHATAKTYRKLIESIRKKVSLQILGLTATPFRTAKEEQGLLTKVFPDGIIHKTDLITLINRGFLSEPHFEEVVTGVNFVENLSDEQIKQLNRFDIDSISSEIASTIAENSVRNSLIVNKYINQKEKYKPTIIFALNKANAIALHTLFKKRGVKSEYVVSSIKDSVTGVTTSNKDNKRKIDEFRDGKIDVLINVNILTEGTDLPKVQSVFLARPTISSILMTQMIGRGLRGLKAGGTEKAHIVSFIDDWQNRIAWVNPEKLFASEDDIDFNDIDRETRERLIRLIAISKIEEFAILANEIIDPAAKAEIENLNFIERFPTGIYQFRLLEQKDNESIERDCEILVYNNLLQSYIDFINALPSFFEQEGLTESDFLTESDLNKYAEQIENELFAGTVKYPAYHLQDIKDILQYYAVQDEVPAYLALKDREKYDIDKIAEEINDKNLGEKEQTLYRNKIWENDKFAWQTFFGYDKKIFLQEIDLAKRKISDPDLYLKKSVIPNVVKESRSYEELTMQQLREEDPIYEKRLRDSVFKKFSDGNGLYHSANGDFKSRNKLDFQIDHIDPIAKGGLTKLKNLQLLTRKENAIKGSS